jgi:hypothetical protein
VAEHLSDEQVADLALALAVFQGFVRIIIALGLEPVPGTMPVQVLPKP